GIDGQMAQMPKQSSVRADSRGPASSTVLLVMSGSRLHGRPSRGWTQRSAVGTHSGWRRLLRGRFRPGAAPAGPGADPGDAPFGNHAALSGRDFIKHQIGAGFTRFEIERRVEAVLPEDEVHVGNVAAVRGPARIRVDAWHVAADRPPLRREIVRFDLD